MSFGESISTVFSKYATFSGRARRSEYWWWYLFVVIVSAVIGGIAGATGGSDGSSIGTILSAVVGLGFLLPNLAVGARRLHDTGRSGWWLLIGLIPLIGAIVLLVFFVMDSEPDNEYGPNPKGRAVVTA